eukprot:11220028-Lingulodinium_polyedra.AAC.1
MNDLVRFQGWRIAGIQEVMIDSRQRARQLGKALGNGASVNAFYCIWPSVVYAVGLLYSPLFPDAYRAKFCDLEHSHSQ